MQSDGSFTEAEARKMTCPFFRYVYNEAGVIRDREAAIYVHQNCMASDCIAWRWRELFNAGNDLRGYCGSAGKPT